MSESKTTGILVVAVLFLSLIAVVLWVNKSPVTGNTVTDNVVKTSGGEVMGFNSYDEMMEAHHGSGSQQFSSQEEMMAAHHGTGAAGVGGCGGH